jgi:hypothetical protein
MRPDAAHASGSIASPASTDKARRLAGVDGTISVHALSKA